MPFLTRFSGGQGESKLNTVGSGGSQNYHFTCCTC